MCSEPGFGASVSGSRTTSGAGSRSRPRLWAARRWPRLRRLPHPLRFCVGTAASSQPSTMAARTGAQADLRRRRTSQGHSRDAQWVALAGSCRRHGLYSLTASCPEIQTNSKTRVGPSPSSSIIIVESATIKGLATRLCFWTWRGPEYSPGPPNKRRSALIHFTRKNSRLCGRKLRLTDDERRRLRSKVATKAARAR